MTSLCVIVPIYNVEPYLEECLDSLLHQEIDDYEVILVNDGSTDGSQRIIDRYVAAYPGIFRAVWQENQGFSAARNTGLTYCTKEFVAFLDSDDFISENGYSAVLSAMQKDNADIGVFESVWRYPDGRQEHRPTLPPFLGEFNVRTSILSHCSANNRIFRTSLWRESGWQFPVGLWYEDLAIIPAFSTLTDRIFLYPFPIHQYRQREGSIMSRGKYSPRCMEIIPACQNVYSLLHGKGFEAELEYLLTFQLCYYASFRFLAFQKYEEIRTCLAALAALYPHWEQNGYYKERPFLFRFYCRLLRRGHVRLASLLAKCRGKN